MTPNNRLLRWTLQANGCFSLFSGALVLTFARPLADLMGVTEPFWIWALGPGLLVFGALVLSLGTRNSPPEQLVKWVIRLDWSWVAGSAALVLAAGEWLSTTGIWLVVDLSIVVGIFALLQQVGLRRALDNPGDAAPRAQ